MDDGDVTSGAGPQLGQQQAGLGGGLAQPQQQQAFSTSILGLPPAYMPQPSGSGQQPGGVTMTTNTAGQGGLQLGQGLGSGLQQGGRGLQLGQGLQQGQGLQLGQGLQQGQGLGQGLQQGQGLGQGLQQGQGLGQGLQQGQGLGQGLQQGQGLGQGLQQGQGLQLGQGLQQGQGLQLGQGLQQGQGLGQGLQQGQGLQLGQGLQQGQGLGQGLQQGQGLQLGQGLQQGQGLQLGQGLQQGQGLGQGLQQGQGLGQGLQQGQGLQLGQGLQQGQGLQLGQGLQQGQGQGQGQTSKTVTSNALTLPSSLSSTAGLSGLPGTQTTATGQATSGVTMPTTTIGATTSLPEPSLAGTTSQAAVRGLGGVDQSAVKGASTTTIVRSVYDEQLPEVLQQLVAEFGKFMKQQREVGDEINRHNDGVIKKVRQDIDTHCQNLAAVSAKIQDEAQMIGFLKQQTCEELKSSEVAQRTRDMPSSLQYDNTAPDEYFRTMVVIFEEKVQLYSSQMDELQSHLTVGGGGPVFTHQSENLIDILQTQYKPFLVLAAQLQTLHEQVESLREQYLTYRYVFLQDTTDVFEERRKYVKLEGSQQVKRGPPPFSSVMGQATAALVAATSQDPSQDRTSGNQGNFQLSSLTNFPANLGQNTLGFGGIQQPSFGGIGGGGGGGLAALNLNNQAAGAAMGQTGAFTLQKPPPGKRKH